ncbi:reverse transcriptase [Elysia marginata]|uniref:Reverse transcriptase n=1 Tax=Elysia marginata TaxID=1093978 RepID=A0AAV4JLD0_9GAST|nr:reverse transcriptase [Elysia marginata]
MYYVPEDIQVTLDDHFNGFYLRFSTSDYTTNWINLEVGIATGCSSPRMLFAMIMEVKLKAAEGSAGPSNLDGGFSTPPLNLKNAPRKDETQRTLARLDT